MNELITSGSGSGPQRPHIPVIYEEACRALTACLDIDEAKEWADKSEALSAWAKIYHDNEAARKARALRLLAYRRMGQLAAEIRPPRARYKGPGRKGGPPGPEALLREHGLSSGNASSARRLALMSESQFDKYFKSPHPPAPSSLAQYGASSSPEWTIFKIAFGSFASACSRYDSAKMASGLTEMEARWAREKTRAICDWLDEFERRLKT